MVMPLAKIKISVILVTLFVSAAGQSTEMKGSPAASAVNPPGPVTQKFPLTAFAAIGSSFVQMSHLDELDMTEEQITAFLDGVRAAFRGKGYLSDETARQLRTAMAQRMLEFETRKQKQAAEKLAQPGQLAQYMKEMRKRFQLQLSDSGLAFNIQTGQLGVRPRPGDTVVVSCEARAADGTTRLPQLSNDHVRVKLADLLPGFMEGLQMMTIDSTAIFLLPPGLSFGEHDWPEGVERGMPLLFMVTLHDVVATESAP